MKTLVTISLLACFLSNGFAASSPARVRTLKDLNVISTRVLRRSVSTKFYNSLLISPVEGWVAVRGQLVGTRLGTLRITHSELNGAYDSLALELARNAQIAGYYAIDKQLRTGSVLFHVLIFRCADGPLVLSFPQLDEAGGDQVPYFGCAQLAVLKSDGKWTEIKGPRDLYGKGWEVRSNFNRSLTAIYKLDVLRMHF